LVKINFFLEELAKIIVFKYRQHKNTLFLKMRTIY